jgi:multidrug efflux pump subunit AcrB
MSRRLPKSLGEKTSLAALLTDTFVTSRLTVAFILACALIGAWALLETPRQDNPRIVVPAARISVEMPGATPAEMEALVVRPIEALVRTLDGVDELDAVMHNSLAVLNVTFLTSETQEDVLVRLNDRVAARREVLPAEAGPIVIRGMNVDDVPIVTLTLVTSTYDDYALKRVADRVADGLRTVPGTGGVEVQGGIDREVRVELDPDRMQAFGVTLDQVRQLLAAGNVAAPLGSVVRAGERHELFVDGFIHGADDVARTVVGNHNGRPVHLGDVATVVDGASPERTQMTRLAFGPGDPRFDSTADAERPAVTVTVAKTAGANAVSVAKNVLARVALMQHDFIPAGIDVVVTRNDGELANDTINGLINHLLVAIAAVFLVVTLFLGLRQALVVGVGIPLVLALTLGMVYLAGYSINRVTLFGLILSLGLLVDDAIVVIENVHRHYLKPGVTDRRAATVLATREIGNATNLATLAVMVVFLSLMLVTGMSGQFFYPIAYTVPVAMAASLLVAYTVVPWAAFKLLPADAHHTAEHALTARLEGLLRRYVTVLVDDRRRRRRTVLVVVGLLCLSLLIPAWQFIRPGRGERTNVLVRPGNGHDARRQQEHVQYRGNAAGKRGDRKRQTVSPGARTSALQHCAKVPEDKRLPGVAGSLRDHRLQRHAAWQRATSAGEHYAEIRVNLVDKHMRGIAKSHDVVRDVAPRCCRTLAATRTGCHRAIGRRPAGSTGARQHLRGNLRT